MKKAQITILPTAGLCNRMRALASAISYVNKNNFAGCQYIWERNKDCYAYYDELFENINNIKIYNTHKFYLRESSKRNLYLPSLCRKLSFDAQISDAQIIINADRLAANVDGKKHVFIQSYSILAGCDIRADLAGMFKPVQKLQQRINDITASFNGSVIGLHVRRTDNIKSIESSSDKKFFDVIDAELERDKDTRFYLATDSSDVKQSFKRMYGDKIISYDFELSRECKRGIEDAVVDLYALASTKKIYGSYWSSYSETASWLFNKPLIIVK